MNFRNGCNNSFNLEDMSNALQCIEFILLQARHIEYVARAKEQNSINITIFIYMRKDMKFVQIRRANKWHGVKFQTVTTCASILHADGVDICEVFSQNSYI